MQETQDPMTVRPGQVLGNYTLLREAGRGGMSVVYEARDDRMERRVALKVLTVPSHFSPLQREEMIARLRLEARAIARLSHPNVVHVYDVGEQAGAHYIVMEYLDGQTLRERLDAALVSPEEASRILAQVGRALDAVHAEGVLHRDIKPSNVMLLPDGRVKLMDFGVARRADDTLVTQVGMMVGSPAYMAPELVNGGEASVTSDLWSLGVLLYQMLAGRPPFGSKNIPAVLYQIAHEDPQPLPGAPPGVQRVIQRALDKNPAKRFSSGREMADAFRAAIAQPMPQAAAPPSLRRRPPPRWIGPALAGLFLIPATLGASLLGRWLAAKHRVAPAPIAQTAVRPPVRQAYQAAPAFAPSRPARAKPIVRVAESRPEKRVSAPAVPRRQKPRRVAPHTPVTARRVARPAPVRLAKRHAPVRRVKRFALAPRVARPAPVRRVPHVAPASARRAPHSVAVATPRRTHQWRRPPIRIARRRMPAARHTPQQAPQVAKLSPATTPAPSGLEGTWHGWQGIHGRDPAVLKIIHHKGSTFDGVMTVHTPERATVRVALTGHVSPSGQVTMRERKILSSTKPNAWDLGSKTGQIGPGGQMSGQDHDVRGRTAHWSFSR